MMAPTGYIHLCVPMNPDGRVEDLVEEGLPIHVGVEVIQFLHSDHLPAENDKQRISIKVKSQYQGLVSKIRRIGMKVYSFYISQFFILLQCLPVRIMIFIVTC